jgi:ketosteroid isomerase-like protein
VAFHLYDPRAAARADRLEGTTMTTQSANLANKSMLPLVSAALVTSLLAGCATRESTLPNDVTTALASAFTRGDVAACTELYSDDAEIISNEAPTVRGREAIEEFFRDQVSRDILFATDSTVSVVNGDLAMDQGTYRVRNVNRGVDVEYGSYLNVWRLENGEWRVFRSMYNVTMGPKVHVSVAPATDDVPVAHVAS